MTSETIAGFVSCHEVYATHIDEANQRWGRILARDGYILMQDFRNEKPPTDDALVFNLSEMTEHVSYPRHVYLVFSTLGSHATALGMVVIKVNEEAPRRAQQLIDLCQGQTGARYSGTTAIDVVNKGMPYERIRIRYYLTSNNKNSNENLFPDLEDTVDITHIQRSVGVLYNNCADFGITTTSDIGLWEGPAIGEVVSGLPVLEKIIKDNLVQEDYLKSHVFISESGIVIASSCQK